MQNMKNDNLAGDWQQIEIAGHPCYTYVPPQPSEHGYTVLYMHGYYQGVPMEHPKMMEHFDRHGLRVIAPLTRRSWWSERICPDFDPEITVVDYLMNEVLPYLEKEWQCVPPQIALMGASMGGQGALRLSYKRPNIFPVVTAFFPAVDFQIRIEEGDKILSKMYSDAEDARQDTATLHIHPLNWPRHQWFCCDPVDVRWHDSADRLRMKLFSLGVLHECDLETSAGGHTWEYVEHMAERAVDFVAERLEQERLRVVH